MQSAVISRHYWLCTSPTPTPKSASKTSFFYSIKSSPTSSSALSQNTLKPGIFEVFARCQTLCLLFCGLPGTTSFRRRQDGGLHQVHHLVDQSRASRLCGKCSVCFEVRFEKGCYSQSQQRRPSGVQGFAFQLLGGRGREGSV